MKKLLALLAGLALLSGGCDEGFTSEGAATENPDSANYTHEVVQDTDDDGDGPLDEDETEDGSDLSSGSHSIDYQNPNTGYSSTYDLDVDVHSDGEIERINFPNGGWEDDFVSQEDNGDGTVTVTTDDGREFTVDQD